MLPSQLFEVFERIARPNTNREPYGIETCGILAGKVVRNQHLQIAESRREHVPDVPGFRPIS